MRGGFQVLWAIVVISCSDGAKVSKRNPPYSIEMRVLVDSYAFDNWKGYVASSVPASRKDAVTRSAMTNYIKSAVNDLNTIFDRLSRSGINIDVRIVSIAFVTEKISYEYGGRISSSKVLGEFREWLSSKNYPTVDHTMLLTGLDLITTGGNSGTLGVAYTSKMCHTDFSLSVVEAQPTGAVTVTMAHELGHSLSAKHDGEGNTCTTGSNIMKATNEARGASNQNFRFSSCSVFYFSQFLRGGDSSCLLQTRAETTTATPLGQLYSPDQMCQMVEGAQSFVCRSFYGAGQRAYSELCVTAMCSKPGTNQCVSITAADGFPCGQGKRCSLGNCVDDGNAGSNTVTDTCPLGDSPFPLSYLQGESCGDGVSSHPGNCYQPYLRRVCCKSCQDARRSDKDCEYGDQATWCSSLTNYQCYLNSEVCCATCDKYKTSNAACKFGDKAPWCATLAAEHCPLNRAVCCQKCT